MSDFQRNTSQQQFLKVIDRDEAERRFTDALELAPLGVELVSLTDALGRILAQDIIARVDVPSFDRSNLDGFALRAEDTISATEESPRRLGLSGEIIATAVVPKRAVKPQIATPIATGGMIPRGADAVMMIEHTDMDDETVLVYRAVTPGTGISFAGTDIGIGETVLRQGDRLTSRETGVLAAIGEHQVPVHRQPRVAIVSTGDEIIAPDAAMKPGFVFDSNAQILADAVTELGGVAVRMGIVNDDLPELRQIVKEALQHNDVVLLSGGTSKGAGDLSYRAVSELNDPGIVAHGVALKPGKPICLAVSSGKAVVILPGFPTSAVFTFHEFVAPHIRRLAGSTHCEQDVVDAQMAVKVNSEVGRTEYLLVGLVERPSETDSTSRCVGDGNSVDGTPCTDRQLAAYPMGKGSGSVTTFSHADGFVTIGRHDEILAQGQPVTVRLLGSQLQRADLVMIGSHCVGSDRLLGKMQRLGFRSKFLAVGSMAGLAAIKRGECDVAGIHLLDAKTGEYNRPFLDDSMTLVPGYIRQQGILFRPDDERFRGRTVEDAIECALKDADCIMVNRNQGSGTRILIDQLVQNERPSGYANQPKSHNAVAASIAQERADWGVAIQRVAESAELGFLPLATEHYDFVIPTARIDRPAVRQWIELLDSDRVRAELVELGLKTANRL